MNWGDHDTFRRGGARQRGARVSALHFALLLAAAGLLVLSRVGHPLVGQIEGAAHGLVQPALEAVAEGARPVRRIASNAARYLTVETDLERLERELASLKNLLERASDLEARNRELAGLARLVAAAPVDALTVEVVAGRQGLFSQTVTIGAGRRQGIRDGQPVFSAAGLFGRILEVEETRARVLMLNDQTSRIAVEVGAARVPALLVGDNSVELRLVELDRTAVPMVGAEVATSGASGAFPRGIRVGKVVMFGGEVRVAPAARLVPGRYLTVMTYALTSPFEGGGGEGPDGGEAAARADLLGDSGGEGGL